MAKIKIKVDFYDKKHEVLVKENSLAFPKIKKMVTEGFSVEEEEFYTYAIFREQKQRPNWRTYKDLEHYLPNRLQQFNDYFEIGPNGLVSKFSSQDETDNALTEGVGVGAALAVLSHAYDLTEADWEKIPVGIVKDLDFQIASTGQDFVEVEAKGAIVDDPKMLTEISGRAGHIKEKKIAQRNAGNKNVFFGVIASIPWQTDQEMVCRVLDPEPNVPNISPGKYDLARI